MHTKSRYKKSLTVINNVARRELFCLSELYGASNVYVNINIPTCEAVIRTLSYKQLSRLDKAENCTINALLNPTISCTCILDTVSGEICTFNEAEVLLNAMLLLWLSICRHVSF